MNANERNTSGASAREKLKHCDRAEQVEGTGGVYQGLERCNSRGEARHVAGQGRNCKGRCMEHWKVARTLEDWVERSTT